MKLLIITQKVDENDDVLGFFHGWLCEFAKQCEQIIVICLQAGRHHLPANVKVLSLGKENGRSKLKYFFNFYRYIWQERKNYDAVFVHMNPEYVVLGGLFWKLSHKKIALWYTHKSITSKLRVAEKFVDVIFTASAESFRLPSKKIRVMGHGIDVERFVPASNFPQEKIILSVDRISPTKNQLELVEIFSKIIKEVPDARLYVVGAPVREADRAYERALHQYVKNNKFTDVVIFMGAVPNKDMPALYQKAWVCVNLSATGSLDKTVLEAMACNVPVVTTNEAFAGIIPEGYVQGETDVIKKIIVFLGERTHYDYRDAIVQDHSLTKLISALVTQLRS
jgi:glycosyltransferase involved in cell wall biosynthesis